MAETDIHQKPIIVLDFGSQYTQLIARRIRELGVYCEIHSYLAPTDNWQALAPSGLILSGGPESTTEYDAPKAPGEIFELGLPILGICYGMQTMVQQMGGAVRHQGKAEFGLAHLQLCQPSALFDGLINSSDEPFQVWMSHGDEVVTLPAGFECLAKTTQGVMGAIVNESKQFYGLQFHPEVTHTPCGIELLKRFVLQICKALPVWQPKAIVDEAIAHIRAQVGHDKVILGLSGGVDSAVVAAMLHRAIGAQLQCIFVDNGLLRANERDEVMATFGQHQGMNIECVDASSAFLKDLEGVSCPEEKRKKIGHRFIEVFQTQAKKYKDAKWLAQGTIYPDVIESAKLEFQHAHVIKSHHNVGGLPEDMHLALIEPLRDLFKDEVRQIGLTLGLPETMVFRHPFPGPGLAVRVLGEVRPEYLEPLRLADAIFIQALRAKGFYRQVSQAFVVFLPVKAVGVVGDARRYEYVVSLRAVETTDFMTAQWAHLPHDFLTEVATQIINEVPQIARVTYDISNKPPATIEWE